MSTATYHRPVEAKLYVHLDNGEQFEAGPEDLSKFGLSRDIDTYRRIDSYLRNALRQEFGHEEDLTHNPGLNAVRYLAEAMIVHPHLYDQNADEYDAGLLPMLEVIAGLDDITAMAEHSGGTDG